MDKKILVLIPCYNEEQNIVNTVERLKDTCPDVDFLVINDCSTDGSAALLQSHGYPFLDLPVNLGIGGGVQCGYRYAKRCGYDVAVQMDGDGQHDPPRTCMRSYSRCWTAAAICASAAALSKRKGSRPVLCGGWASAF